jgi:hypothetical protein
MASSPGREGKVKIPLSGICPLSYSTEIGQVAIQGFLWAEKALDSDYSRGHQEGPLRDHQRDEGSTHND